MLLLLDIGNTHTHFAVWTGSAFQREGEVPTAQWLSGRVPAAIEMAVRRPRSIALCSVVPEATRRAQRALERRWDQTAFELNHTTARGIDIDYPSPATIGADRLANAIAARNEFGAPVVVVDFGTAVTFDVVDGRGAYVGGIIAPGLAVMTSYLHERTALLPRIEIGDTTAVIGKSTKEAMLIGAIHGYRGLVRELLRQLKRELGQKRLRVIGTGGYAGLIAYGLREIEHVDPLITLKGLRLAWQARRRQGSPRFR